MNTALWIIGVLAALFALDRLFLWMEAKGWIYWRKKKSSSSAGGIFGAADFTNPGAKYLEDAREERTLGEDEDNGDDESKRPAEDRPT